MGKFCPKNGNIMNIHADPAAGPVKEEQKCKGMHVFLQKFYGNFEENPV